VVEAEIEVNIRIALRKIYYSLSGDAQSLARWLARPEGGDILHSLEDPESFPPWITDNDLDYFAANFEAGGFRGPVNRYRNQVRDFEALSGMGVKSIIQPSCFVAGSKNVVRSFRSGLDIYADVLGNSTDLRVGEIINGIGHCVQQEAPDAVNEALLEFLGSLN